MSNKKLLIATPMMPPTAGGPATHAKKFYEYFAPTTPTPPPSGGEISANLFNFEKYKKYPSGVRHILTFFDFVNPFSKNYFRKYDLILALDGFTVALPAVLAGIILRKKVILRIGGDFIYEEFLNIQEVTFADFYNNFAKYKKIIKQKNYKLYIKYLVQKFVLENCSGIIFNTAWQKDIYLKQYKFKNNGDIFVIQNPIETIAKKVYENEKLNQNFENARKQNKCIFTSITRDIPYKNLTRLKQVFQEFSTSPDLSLQRRGEVHLETQQGSHESCLKRISLSRAYICASISDISPNQVQEALSLKIPIIISKYTGLTDILKKAGVARVVDPFDIQDIKNAIMEMCDENIWQKYKKNLESFTWPQNWESLFKQYLEIWN